MEPEDFLALLSPAALPHLERIAVRARELTLQYHGRAVQLFTPLYLANFCTNRCRYCGFNAGNRIRRTRLSMEEIEREGQAIAATGLRSILLLTGDAPRMTGPDYMAEAVRRLRPLFPEIGVEVYSLATQEYALLAQNGVHSMTLFQETYNETRYLDLHPAGPKRDFRFRLESQHRAALAGMRAVSVGALIGLDHWRRDAFFTGLHADWLQTRHPDVEVGVSVPRMRPHEGSPITIHPNSEKDLVQYILALRLFLPRAGITVSTRERAFLRDHLLQLGVTRVSAGVSVAVGGHADSRDGTGQFDIADERDVDGMAAAIRARGCQPVFKNWEQFANETREPL
jgi:2-iminoacetate synthase